MSWLKQLFCSHYWIEEKPLDKYMPLAYQFIYGKGQCLPYTCKKCKKIILSFNLPINYIKD